jgi:hypothetical protein
MLTKVEREAEAKARSAVMPLELATALRERLGQAFRAQRKVFKGFTPECDAFAMGLYVRLVFKRRPVGGVAVSWEELYGLMAKLALMRSRINYPELRNNVARYYAHVLAERLAPYTKDDLQVPMRDVCARCHGVADLQRGLCKPCTLIEERIADERGRTVAERLVAMSFEEAP